MATQVVYLWRNYHDDFIVPRKPQCHALFHDHCILSKITQMIFPTLGNKPHLSCAENKTTLSIMFIVLQVQLKIGHR